MRKYCIYILSSRSRTLYIGVTNDLERRLYEHRTCAHGFTSKYRITRLVYLECCDQPIVAIAREKQLKGLSRKKKITFITSQNPAWNDLSADFL